MLSKNIKYCINTNVITIYLDFHLSPWIQQNTSGWLHTTIKILPGLLCAASFKHMYILKFEHSCMNITAINQWRFQDLTWGAPSDVWCVSAMGAIWLNNIRPGGVHMFCIQAMGTVHCRWLTQLEIV